MVIIKLSKNSVNIVFLSILAIIIGTGLFFFCWNFFDSPAVQTSSRIEFFDIGRGEVIKQIEPDRKTFTQAKNLLKKITGLYLKFKPLPDKGHIIRITFEPPTKVKNRFLNDCGIDSVDALYILFPEEGAPYLLVLDKKQRPWFFYTKEDISILIGPLLKDSK